MLSPKINMHLSQSHKKRLQLLRERKKDADSVSDNTSKNNDQLPKEIATPIKRAAKKNETSPENDMKNMLNTTDNDTKKCQCNCHCSRNNSCTNNKEDTDPIKQINKDSKLWNKNQRSLEFVIRVRKIEDLCNPSQKSKISDNSENNESIKENDIESLHISNPFVPLSSMEWNPHNTKALLGMPVSCKKEKQIFDNYTPTKQEKRKSSLDISDIDQLSDTFKSEFHNSLSTDMEPIDMLHDLNSIMDFEEIKIPADVFTPTASEATHNEYDAEMSKDPLTDVFIANYDEHNTTVENVNHENKKMRVKDTQITHNQVKRKSNVKHDVESTHVSKPCNTETTDYLKDVLGELDIESKAKNEEISKFHLKKLYDLKVKLTHDVPPQHKIQQCSGTRGLTKAEKQLFLKYGPIKNGVFSPNEDKIILNNWKTFCEIHEWNPKHVKPFIYMKYRSKLSIRNKEERMKFVQFLANGLPWRSLYSVYRRFKFLHTDHNKSFKRYTLSEDQKILSYMKKQTHNKFGKLAKILGRTRHSVWLRYQMLKKMQEHPKKNPVSDVTWTLPLIGKFIKTLMDVTLCDTVSELKGAIIPKVIWSKLEGKLNIEQTVLKLFWIYQLHMQLFCPEPIYLNDIKIKLIEYIYGKGIAHTREIIWPNVAKYFDGMTTVFLCRTFYYLVADAGIKICTRDFIEIIEYLYKEKITEIKTNSTDKLLPRLLYENGKVKILDEDQQDDSDTSD